MDLNQLLYHHQLALMSESLPRSALGSRFDLVRHYAKRIRSHRQDLGLGEYGAAAQEANR